MLEVAPPSHPDVIGYEPPPRGNDTVEAPKTSQIDPIAEYTDAYQALRSIGLATDTELFGAKAPPQQYQMLSREGQDFLLSMIQDGTLEKIAIATKEDPATTRFNIDLQEEALDNVLNVRDGIASRRVTYTKDGALGLNESTRELFSGQIMNRILQNMDVLKSIAARHYGDADDVGAIQ